MKKVIHIISFVAVGFLLFRCQQELDSASTSGSSQALSLPSTESITSPSTIGGSVFYQLGTDSLIDIPGVRIEFQKVGQKIPVVIYTYANGHYQINLENGYYAVKAYKTGFEDYVYPILLSVPSQASAFNLEMKAVANF
jgi:hypothetical protein